MTQAEKHFESKRKAINEATTVKEVIAAYCSDVLERIRKEYERQEMKKSNRLYRGDLSKIKAHYGIQVNIDEHNYWEAEIEDELHLI